MPPSFSLLLARARSAKKDTKTTKAPPDSRPPLATLASWRSSPFFVVFAPFVVLVSKFLPATNAMYVRF